jgi:tRNA A-37 threonylcarbamoyl transferase component Bud32
MHPLADTGRVIAGRYRLEAPVGRGAMGIVWRARDQLLDRDVAVKEVQMADTLTEHERANAYQRTLREAKTAARLSHPGVVSVYDVADDGGRPWIVMELVNAQSLDQVLASSGPLSPRQTAEIGRQLLSALSVAHGAGVLHRDVKPSNVLLGTDGRAVLTDFGIATFQGDPKLTQTGMVMGSPGFTAPERIRGGGATPASDLWSLGATLYAAVQGHGPYESRGGAITTMSAIINEDAPAAPAAGALGGVIEALLRREPADRPDAVTASRMMSDVMHLLPDRPNGAPGYVPTAMSAASSDGPGDTSLDAHGFTEHPTSPGLPNAAEMPSRAAETPSWGAAGPEASPWAPAAEAASLGPAGGAASLGPAAEAASVTAPQPGLDDAGAGVAGASAGAGAGAGAAEAGAAGGFGGFGADAGFGAERDLGSGGSTSRFPAPPAPDFSSWYDSSPRSGSAARDGARYQPPGHEPAAYGASPGYGPSGYGSSAQAGGTAAPAWPSAPAGPYGPSDPPTWGHPTRGPRRSGLRWKLALVALAVIGAGAGAATIMALRHHTSTPSGSQQTQTTGPASSGSVLQIVDAINMPLSATGSLPAGYTTYTLAPGTTGTTAGFQLDYPSSWGVLRPSALRTRLQDPVQNTYLLVDLTKHTFANMLTEARYIKRQSIARGSFPGYHEIGLARTNVRGQPGAFWKFTWLDNGIKQEVLDLLYVANTSAGPQSYALYFTAPASQWNAMHTYFNEEARTFGTLPS